MVFKSYDMEKKQILVIGGGIVGLSSAYYLSKSGHSVTVLDKGDINKGASFVNAGYLTPSHIIPLASPGMVAKGLKMMFNSASPFYIKPRWDGEFLKWAWYFYRSCTPNHVKKAIPAIKDINLLSRELYEEIHRSKDLGTFHLDRKGLLMLYQTEASLEHEKSVASKASQLGLEVGYLNKAQLDAMEPDMDINAMGAIHYECDGHMTPTEFMPKMCTYLQKKGVKIITQETVLNIKTKGNKILEVLTEKNSYLPDEVVFAAGAWSASLALSIGIKLSLQGGKGYRIDVKRPTGIRMPAILMEANMAVTPMNGFTRFAGTMEFSGNNDIVRKERVLALVKGAKKYYPELEITDQEINEARTGLRPVSPDGLPYIGRSKKYGNLLFATGHAMMGWSLGPATGKLITELVDGVETSIPVDAFHPDRTFG
jgi:D-amino-acid dehydrogenase